MRIRSPFLVAAALVLLATVATPADGADKNSGPVPPPQAIDRAAVARDVASSGRADAVQRGLDAEAWEQDVERALARLDEGKLMLAKAARSWSEVAKLLGVKEPDSLGSATDNLVYFPLTPCRILDTRYGTGQWAGPLAAGSTTYVYHNSSMASQGGNTAGCGVPSDPVQIAATVTAVNAAGPGDLRLFAYMGTEPNASALNYSNVAGLNLANSTNIPICQICGPDFNIKVDVGAVHVIVDVVGYYMAASFPNQPGFVYAAVHVTGGVSPTITRSFNLTGGGTPTVTRVTTGEYRVGFGTDVSGRHYAVSLGNPASGVPGTGNCSATPSASSVNEVYVDCYDLSGTGTDNNFYLQVF